MTISVNPTLTTAETIFKNIVWNPLVMAGETALFSWAPVLDAPVIGAIDKALIGGFADAIFNALVQFIDIESIEFLNDTHQSTYETASEALKIIAEEKGIDSAEFQQAQAEAIKEMQAFTSLSGQPTVQ